MEKVSGKFSHLENMARTIAVPRLNRPRRVPTFPALERTALLGFTDTGTMEVKTLPDTTVVPCAVLVRDPAYPLWTMAQMPLMGSFYYDVPLDTGTATLAAGEEVSIPCPGTIPNLNTAGTWGNLKRRFPVVVWKGNQYMLLGGGDGNVDPFTIAVETEASVAYSKITVFCEYLQEAFGEITAVFRTKTAPCTSSGAFNSAIWDTENNGYLAVRFLSVTMETAATGTSITALRLGFGTTQTDLANPLTGPSTGIVCARLIPHFAPPALEDSILPYRGSRATAVACLFSNVTKVLNKEGTVQGARVATDSFPVFQPTLWSFGVLHPKDRYFGALENGLYAYTLADNSTDLFKDTANEDQALFNLDGFNYAVVVQFVDQDLDTVTTLALTLDRHVEFRSSSLLFNTDYCRESLESYHQAQLALLGMGCIMENPTHLANIAAMAARAVKAAWPVVKPIAYAVGRKAVAHAADWANKKLGVMTQKQMTQPKQQKPARRKTPARKPARARR